MIKIYIKMIMYVKIQKKRNMYAKWLIFFVLRSQEVPVAVGTSLVMSRLILAYMSGTKCVPTVLLTLIKFVEVY